MKPLYQCIFAMVALILISLPVHSANLSNPQQVKDCNFSKSANWWQQGYDSLPNNIANNPVTGDPEFCEFYQFAEDWFLYLISPQSAKTSQANWENTSRFPLLELSGTNSCDKDAPAHSFNLRMIKSADDSSPFQMPERIDQAGADAIYDQQGNVVFYEIRFSRNLCDVKAIQSQANFPGKTLELKMAWRIMTADDDPQQYYQTTAIINDQPQQLGLVGWHIVITADNHPEMVWVTVDHSNNAVVCDQIGVQQSAYDFTSQACAKNIKDCNNLNQSLKSTSISLPSDVQPNDICQVFPFGTQASTDTSSRDWLNIALIEKLNDSLQNQLLASANLPTSMKVWKNYQVTGALWISDINKSSSDTSNQRGSLKLANTVMETTFQGDPHTGEGTLNCFVCHNYNAPDSGKSNTAYGANLSHIFDDVIDGQCQDFQAKSVINSQSQAEAACPQVCNAQSLTWHGQWTNQDAKTGAQLPMTVCGCCP